MATAKEFVLERYPDFICESLVFNDRNKAYAVTSRAQVFSYGKTESNAWVNAKAKIIEQENGVVK